MTIAMMALPFILGVSLCCVRPDGVWLWLAAMFFVPASWLGVKATGRILENQDTVDGRRVLSDATIFSSVIVALPLAAKLTDALGLIDGSLAHVIATRWTNALAGGYFVLRGNRLPKILTPLSKRHDDPATIQTLRLHTGRLFVLAGFVFAVLWLTLPAHLAAPVGVSVIVAGILVPSLHMRFLVKRHVR